MLPKLQYIQKVEIHGEMVELYQQFLLKLISAHKEIEVNKSWTVYENTFGTTGSNREFIFIRALSSWSEMDDISREDSLSQIMSKVYGEKESLQWMKIAQKSVKRVTTEVLSKVDVYSLDHSIQGEI